MSRHDIEVDVLIIGGGPAGLTAAAGLAPKVAGSVVVLDREREAGGIPRHSDHLGYGIRDLKTVMNGPAYARRLVGKALAAGADIRTGEMVTNWCWADLGRGHRPGRPVSHHGQGRHPGHRARERPETGPARAR